jgi:hypothetical protein
MTPPALRQKPLARRPWYAWPLSAWWSLRDVMKALWQERLGGLLPVVLILFLLAAVLSFLTAISPIAPFVYPLF